MNEDLKPTLKKKIYHLVEKGAHGSLINLFFDYFIISLIIFNVLAIALDSLTDLTERLKISLRIFEIVSVVIFTVEFILRLYVSDITHPAKSKTRSALKFLMSPFGFVDMLAILPFYLPFIIRIDLRFLRMLRLVRFFRVFKISRYNSTLKLIRDVLNEKKAEIGMTFFIVILLLLVAGFLIYSVENPVQPEKFPNIFSSLWWALATLTSIGSGDIYPITTLGKIISGIIALLGIGIIALPTGIISAGFIEKINRQKNKSTFCPHCGKEIDLL